MKDIIEGMKEVLHTLGFHGDDMVMNAAVQEIGMDDLDVVEFVMGIEDYFEIEIEDSEFGDGTEITYSDVYKIIQREY